ncbi:MAG TPA: class I SAM-dependent methyltransferase [Roseiflexaceae bacterium]|nr:class I SAM-dependent methyltransferase [Roseiflexaceae bacterium]
MIYRDYATIYDLADQGRFGAWMATWTLERLRACGERPQTVLDLACGSGTAIQVFASAGCRVVGVDRSAAMLAQARARQPAQADVLLAEGDIRALDEALAPLVAQGVGPGAFDLAVCFADSLNYQTGDGDLERVLAGARTALRPGGYLVCDLNSPAEFATWDERDLVSYDGADCLVYNRLSYDPDTRLGTGRIVWFARDGGRWWRGEETHTERAWDHAELAAAATAVGLTLIERHSPDGTPVSEETRRVIYVMRHA